VRETAACRASISLPKQAHLLIPRLASYDGDTGSGRKMRAVLRISESLPMSFQPVNRDLARRSANEDMETCTVSCSIQSYISDLILINSHEIGTSLLDRVCALIEFNQDDSTSQRNQDTASVPLLHIFTNPISHHQSNPISTISAKKRIAKSNLDGLGLRIVG
jgi:hypothetical protein